MGSVYFLILIVLVAAPLASMITRPARIFEYPFFMAYAFAVFIVPQAFSLLRFPGAVESEAVENVLIMSCLCLGACLFGYLFAPNTIVKLWATRRVDRARLLHVAAVFIAVGYAMGALFSTIDVQYSIRGGMTGTSTILVFFQDLLFPGFAIALFSAMRRPTVVTIGLSVVGIIPLIERAAYGRREDIAMLALSIAMAFYYERNIQPPRWVIASAVIFATLLIPATGTYRGLAAEGRWGDVRNIDLVANFRRYLSQESILELRNAAAIIDSARQDGYREYGTAYWNQLVFRYVPAQLLGNSFKESLMFESKDISSDARTAVLFAPGSTMTGMGDTFLQFGWLGCLFFAFMAVVFKTIWCASLPREALFARLMYSLILTSGMRAVTHWTVDFLPGFLYFVIFLGIAARYASKPRSRRGPSTEGVRMNRPLNVVATMPRESTENPFLNRSNRP